MPKYIIKEGVVDKFIRNVFDNIINKRRQANKKALKSDPQLAAMEKKLAQSTANFLDYIEKNKTYNF